MATELSFVEYIIAQIRNAGTITAKKMFGEYGLYSDGKIFALVCENKLYIKPTEAGEKFFGDGTREAPYPGAKLYFLVEEKLEDGRWLSELIRRSIPELPELKPKKPKLKK